MKHVPQTSLSLLGCLLCIFVIGTSWQTKKYTPRDTASSSVTKADRADTTEPGSAAGGTDEYGMKELKEAMKGLNKEMKELNERLIKIDLPQVEKEVNEAIAKIDIDKITAEAEKSIKSVDWNAIKLEVDKSLQQAQTQIAKINTQEIKAQLKQVQQQLKAQQLNMRLDTAQLHNQVQQSLQHAQQRLQKVQEDMQNTQAFTSDLQAHGLIDKNKPYKIELKNGSLFINGVQQSKQVTDQYHKYYRGHSNWKINTGGNDNDTDDEGTDL